MHYNRTNKTWCKTIKAVTIDFGLHVFLQWVLKAGLSTNNHSFLIRLVTERRRFEILFNPHLYRTVLSDKHKRVKNTRSLNFTMTSETILKCSLKYLSSLAIEINQKTSTFSFSSSTEKHFVIIFTVRYFSFCCCLFRRQQKLLSISLNGEEVH